MKKAFLLILATLMIITLVACGSSSEVTLQKFLDNKGIEGDYEIENYPSHSRDFSRE